MGAAKRSNFANNGAAPTSIPLVPQRTPMYDSDGNMTRTWILYFQQLGGSQNASGGLGNSTATAAPTGGVNPTGGSNPGYYLFQSTPGNLVTIDLANGLKQRFVQFGPGLSVSAPVFSGAAIQAGQPMWLSWDQGNAGNWPAPAFAGGTGAFASDTQRRIGAALNGTPNTRTNCAFTFDGNIWVLDSVFSGFATS